MLYCENKELPLTHGDSCRCVWHTYMLGIRDLHLTNENCAGAKGIHGMLQSNPAKFKSVDGTCRAILGRVRFVILKSCEVQKR